MPKKELKKPDPKITDELMMAQLDEASDPFTPLIASVPRKRTAEIYEDDTPFGKISQGGEIYEKTYDDGSPTGEFTAFPYLSIKLLDKPGSKELEAMRKGYVEAADYLEDIVMEELNDPSLEADYARGLAGEVEEAHRLYESELQGRRDFYAREVPGYLGRAEQIEALKKQLVEAKKDSAQYEESIRKGEKDGQNAPAPQEDASVYNPFSASFSVNSLDNNRRLLDQSREREKQLAEQIAQMENEQAQRLQEWEAKSKDNAELKRYNGRVQIATQRLQTIQAQTAEDAKNFEKYKQKTFDVIKAVGTNHARRSAEGYTKAYLHHKTPLKLGNSLLIACTDTSISRNLIHRVAEYERKDFPLYEVLLKSDETLQSMTDYWKEKAKGPMSAEREDTFRRRLYDQTATMIPLLEKMDESSFDEDRNIEMHKEGVTDKGNEPYHTNSRAARGSHILLASVRAYKMGLENNWAIDDIAPLACFNYLREYSRNQTLFKSSNDRHTYVAFDPPKYINEEHKQWLDDCDKLYDSISRIPLTSSEERAERLDQIREKVREGYEKGYVPEDYANSFNIMYENARKRDAAIEKGTEPAFQDTPNLQIREENKALLRKMEAYEMLDLRPDDPLKANMERVDKRDEKEQEERERIQNKNFVRENNGGKAIPVEKRNWAFEDKMHSFNAKRSSVFLGRESPEHKNLRTAAEALYGQECRLNDSPKPEQLARLFNQIEAVEYYSGVYQQEKKDVNTPAGKERLKGAKELGEYAAGRKQELLEKLNKAYGTDLDMEGMQKKVCREEAQRAGKVLSKNYKNNLGSAEEDIGFVSRAAATLVAYKMSTSAVDSVKEGFKSMGAVAMRNEIMQSKEFKSVIKSAMDAGKMNGQELAESILKGDFVKKMSKVGKQLRQKAEVQATKDGPEKSQQKEKAKPKAAGM